MEKLTEKQATALLTVGNKLSNMAFDLSNLGVYLEVVIDNKGVYSDEDSKKIVEAVSIIQEIAAKAIIAGKKTLNWIADES